MPHIIIEGPDCTGKTTLATALMNAGGRCRFDYRHEGPPPRSTTALRHYAGVLARLNEPTILDRFHLGELVYGPLVRGSSGLSPYALRLLRRVVNGLGVRIVLCLCDYDTALATWKHRQADGNEFLDDEHKYSSSFASFERLHAHAHNIYDYTEGQPTAFWTSAMLSHIPRCLPGVIGSPSARYLFVGDRSNEPFDLPFMGERGSSVFLNTALDHAGYGEGEVAFTNAYTQCGCVANLPARVENGQCVIALGKAASKALQEQYVSVTHELPHPQYWTRFHYKESHQYVDWLRDIKRRRA